MSKKDGFLYCEFCKEVQDDCFEIKDQVSKKVEKLVSDLEKVTSECQERIQKLKWLHKGH